jgi:hypothetical protein
MTNIVISEKDDEVVVESPVSRVIAQEPGDQVVVQEINEQVVVSEIGVAGPRGPAGPSGGQPQVFTQATPAQGWTIVHNLGYRPIVQVFDLEWNLVDVSVGHPSAEQFVVQPDVPLAGYAIYE